tara:strand:+ start:1602 stop:2327 length:726 start_codon:yes stop_codon:yes gene_type:complete
MKSNTAIIHEEAEWKVYLSGFKQKSTNVKTGPLMQVSILVKDTHPFEAVKSGKDSVICGDCIHREATPEVFVDIADSMDDIMALDNVIECPNSTHGTQCIDCGLCYGNVGNKHIAIESHGVSKNRSGSCYVRTEQGPGAIFGADKRGNIPHFGEEHKESLKGQGIRWGAYGDPALIPIPIIQEMEALTGLKNKKGTGYSHMWKDPNMQGHKDMFMASCDNIQDLKEAEALGWRGFIVGTKS